MTLSQIGNHVNSLRRKFSHALSVVRARRLAGDPDDYRPRPYTGAVFPIMTRNLSF